MTVTLAVEKRAQGKKELRTLREAGKVPAVVYGPKEAPQSLAIDRVTFEKLLRDAGESTIITLDGLDTPIEVLIQDVVFDVKKGGVQHVDLYAIERGKELTTNVALEFVGEPPAEKKGCVLTKSVHEVEVTCRPSNLPSEIQVDVTTMEEPGDHILVRDLSIPEGVTVETDPDMTVASVSEVVEEAEEEPVEAVDMDAIEVEEKGKAEDAEEEGESPSS